MKTCTLGNQGLTVSAMGLRCMGMSEFDGAGNEQESIVIPRRHRRCPSVSTCLAGDAGRRGGLAANTFCWTAAAPAGAITGA
jgi:hypothetical protein